MEKEMIQPMRDDWQFQLEVPLNTFNHEIQQKLNIGIRMTLMVLETLH